MNRKNPAGGDAGRAGGFGPSLYRTVALAATLGLALALAPMAQAQRTQVKPGWNMFSPRQDVEVGQQVAYEAERQLPLVYDSRVDDYLNTLGRRLAAHAPGERFPYTYKMVNDPTINAFALPGGPVYINRGVIDAAENEAQLAGVMAHETAHVALRHGTNQASKAYLAQFPLAILGGVMGRNSGGAMLAQLGAGFAAQSLFLKYSRNAETQADIVGAQMLYDSGYDPRALVQFFERIQGRNRGGSSSAFFSNHPNPENRAGRVNQEVQRLGGGGRNLINDSPQFQEIKRYLQGQTGSSMGGYNSDRPRLERAPGSQSDVRPQSPSGRSTQGTSAGSDSDRPRLERAPGSVDPGQYGAPPAGPYDPSTQGTPAGGDSDRPRLERAPGSGDPGQSGAQPQ